MAANLFSACPHVTTVGDFTKEDITHKQEISKCDSCDATGPSLWACLYKECLYVGCGEAFADHSTKHFQKKCEHSLTLNLTTLRVWCYLCECEVFLENNNPPLLQPNSPRKLSGSKVYVADADSDDEEEIENHSLKPRGLTGLQNLGNTCYMNAAIQALSNCPQLTNFFLDCGSYVRSDKKPGLSRSYMRLVKEIWHKRRPSYVVPSGIAYGIKMVCPVFRGYTQQDAQEFLRCFMDQLHEELKEPVHERDSSGARHSESIEDFDSCQGESALPPSEDSSQSDGEFETCDSGLSSEKSSCSEECGEPPELLMADEEEGSNRNMQQSPKWPPDCSKEVSCQGNHVGSVEEKPNKAGGDSSTENEAFNPTSDVSESSSLIGRKSPLSQRSSEKTDSTRQNSYLGLSRLLVGRNPSHQIQRGSISPQPQTVKSAAVRKKKSLSYRSVISDIFDGRILSSVQCLTCDTVSTTRETFQDLSLPIPSRDHLHMLHASQGSQQKAAGACTDVYNKQGWFSWMFGWMFNWIWGPTISLQDCLAAFFSADELKGDNMYSCDKCRKLRNGIKFSKVLQLPEVLCIHLKRFRHEVMFSSKISSYVSFPLYGLDMSPFLHKDCPRGVTTYDLMAVICHHGTAGSGHYTAYALNYLNEQWYEFDDQYVTAVDPQAVQNCEAYVLFYRKCSDEMIKKRSRTIELMERSRCETGLMNFYISKQWVNKFNTFAEPGPINNSDFLCIHGGVHPSKAPFVEELCTLLSQSVWEYLHDSFGGGPACTHLYICPACLSEQEGLDRRRKQEFDTFVALNKDFQIQGSPTVVYAISMYWFKQWEIFLRGKDIDPPGPIDNYTIGIMKNSIPTLKAGSDYGSLSENMWHFLHGIYGGGPEIVLQQNMGVLSHMNFIHPANVHAKSPTLYASSKITNSSQMSAPINTNTVKKLHTEDSASEAVEQEEKDNSSYA